MVPAAAVPLSAPVGVPPSLELWWLSVGEVPNGALDLSVLDAEEERRAGALAADHDRRRYITAHVLVRELLARRLDVGAAEIEFGRRPCPACGGPHGRPEVVWPAGSGLEFSLSHSGDAVLVALLAGAPVGVDVELIPSEETIRAVTPTLPSGQRAVIAEAAPGDRAYAFAATWARLEAYLKGYGTGIAVDLRTVDLAAAGAAGWTIVELDVGSEYAAAVAVAEPEPGGPVGHPYDRPLGGP
jgi:4'-phosphopantetheinyl transferase